MQDNGVQTLSEHEAREALERFVMENDELLDLEARIGRFNIFDALGVVNAEIKHSNFLGWLLDPAESHGAGDLFLKAVLMDMLRQTPEDLRPKGVSPIDLDGAAIASVEIRREWKNIDLLIHCESPRLVVAIENKVRSAEHSGQLSRYKQIVREAFPNEPAMFVFLTREGDDPSDEDWTTYSYADIKRVLERVRRANEGAIGDDVATFLDHYLHLIGSRLMDDAVIDDLCRKIYKNHRQAINLIMDRAGSAASEIIHAARDAIEKRPDRWHVYHTAPHGVHFVPVSWLDVMPPLGSRPNFDPRAWLYISFWVDPRRHCCGLRNIVRRAKDDSLRVAVVKALTAEDSGLGFKRTKSTLGPDWNSLGKERLLGWKEGEEPEPDTVAEMLGKRLEKLWDRLQHSDTLLRHALKSAK